jgi:uncharacterized membrane protein YkoI
MKTTRIAATAAAVVLLGLGGSAIAVAASNASGSSRVSTTTSSSTAEPSPALTADPSTSSTPAAATLSADEASAIALQHVGAGRVTGIERELEHGRTQWKVTVTDGTRTIVVRVDATTAAITQQGLDDSSRSSQGQAGLYDDHGGNRHEPGDDKGGRR